MDRPGPDGTIGCGRATLLVCAHPKEGIIADIRIPWDTMPKKIKLGLECLLLYFVLPPMLYLVRHEIAFRIVFILAATTLACGIILIRDSDFDRQTLRRVQPLGNNLISILRFFLPGALLLGVATMLFLPDKLLAFPRAKPAIWLAIMLLYPLFLAWPQELFFRCFFFQRYRDLFGNPRQMIVANALSFGLAHLFYGNWVAPVLSFFGGLLFAWRYHVSRSLPMVSLEHALWGDFLFTIGVGWYFYSGAIS
jgi:membrane protease YdiL (CAAX protease family)